jgi:hypothetical protein
MESGREIPKTLDDSPYLSYNLPSLKRINDNFSFLAALSACVLIAFSAADSKGQSIGTTGGNDPARFSCIRKPVTLNDVVDHRQNNLGVVTVKDKLIEIKARCRRGRLVDHTGRQIYFYSLTGCWGNPPADYLEILEHQRKEIAQLKIKYSVIEMTCNPSGIPIP